jgi:hypothetical protein
MQLLRIAATGLHTREEVIPVGHSIILLGSLIIKKTE